MINENTKKISYSIFNYFYSLSIVKYILVATLLRLLILFTFIPLYKIYPTNDVPSTFTTMKSFVIVACIIAPIQETFIYQFLPWNIFKLFLKDEMKRKIVFVIVSSLIFGLAHYIKYESIVKILDSFLVGLIFAYTYLLYLEKSKKPFWVTTILHSFINLIVILISVISNYFLNFN